MGDESSSEKSSFNEGMLQIQRLDKSWRSCRTLQISDQLELWALELDRVWIELANDAKKLGGDDEKANTYYKEIEEFDKEINGALKLGDKKERTDANKAYQFLKQKEMFLRRLQDAAGKGSKYEDSDASRMNY